MQHKTRNRLAGLLTAALLLTSGAASAYTDQVFRFKIPGGGAPASSGSGGPVLAAASAGQPFSAPPASGGASGGGSGASCAALPVSYNGWNVDQIQATYSWHTDGAQDSTLTVSNTAGASQTTASFYVSTTSTGAAVREGAFCGTEQTAVSAQLTSYGFVLDGATKQIAREQLTGSLYAPKSSITATTPGQLIHNGKLWDGVNSLGLSGVNYYVADCSIISFYKDVYGSPSVCIWAGTTSPSPYDPAYIWVPDTATTLCASGRSQGCRYDCELWGGVCTGSGEASWTSSEEAFGNTYYIEMYSSLQGSTGRVNVSDGYLGAWAFGNVSEATLSNIMVLPSPPVPEVQAAINGL